MNLLSSKEVVERRKREESEWIGKIHGLRRLHSTLLENIRVSKLNLTEEKEREVAEFHQFQQDMQKKRTVILSEHEGWRQRIENMSGIIDGVQVREDALNEREYKLNEKERNLNDRERIILAGEKHLETYGSNLYRTA